MKIKLVVSTVVLAVSAFAFGASATQTDSKPATKGADKAAAPATAPAAADAGATKAPAPAVDAGAKK